jgi:hypothetical protein
MSIRVADNPQTQAQSPGEKLRDVSAADVEAHLVSTIRKALENVSQEIVWRWWIRRNIPISVHKNIPIPELGAYVDAKALRWRDSGGKEVRALSLSVGFTDWLVDEKTGKLEERVVAKVKVETRTDGCEVRLSTIELPSCWRPLQSLSLLPTAFNAALSALEVEELLSRELGLRLRARGVTVRRMFSAESAERRPVVLMDFDASGLPLTFNNLEVALRRYEGSRTATIICSTLLRHGDRKLARRLYMLAWIKRELEDALRRLKEEGRYSYKKVYVRGGRTGRMRKYVYRVGAEGKKVEIALPYIPVSFFDEEYILSEIWETYEHRSGEVNLAEKIAKKGRRKLKEVEQKSREGLTGLVEKAKELLSSEDFRERELGILLALLIKRAYEDAPRPPTSA